MTHEAFKTTTSFIALDGKKLSHAELATAFTCSLRMV
jgi:hypothetical protein